MGVVLMERMLEELKQTVMDQIVDYMWELYEKDLKWWEDQQENFKIYGSHVMMECVKDGVISVDYLRTVMITKQEAIALFKKQMKERVLELDLQIREKVGTVIAYEFNRNNCKGSSIGHCLERKGTAERQSFLLVSERYLFGFVGCNYYCIEQTATD